MADSILYDQIGSGYNSTRKADCLITEKLFQFLEPLSSRLYLDIGCGTGNYTIALRNKNVQFYGVEPSKEMLESARKKNDEINWVKGRAEEIPVPDEIFYGAIATLTIHHWANLTAAFREISRVLKPNSRIVIFTALPEQMEGYWLNHYFPMMLKDSIIQMPGYRDIEDAAFKAGFSIIQTENYFIQNDLEDNFLYTGKNRPHLYLDEHIRNGISSFSALANQDEVRDGLSKLADDLATNRFNTVKENYASNKGDYIFLTLQLQQKRPIDTND
jgi:ubiquinone/menaquinone biosynthesis C-methylase UbiE